MSQNLQEFTQPSLALTSDNQGFPALPINKSNTPSLEYVENTDENSRQRNSVTRKHFVERVAYAKGYRVLACGTVISPFSGRPLRPMEDGRGAGYFRFKVSCDGKDVNCGVHRLQAYQKFGEQIYAAGLEVRHKNGNSKDNSADNILVGTAQENAMDKPVETRIRVASQANKKHDHAAIREHYAATRSYARTMAAFGLTSKAVLHYALNGRT